MKAVSFHQSLPAADPDSFVDVVMDDPVPGARDLLVEVRAISVNPVDAKIRAGSGPGRPIGELPILGWDAAGVVRAVGPEAAFFAPGDEVYYAGAINRPGSYAQLQCVDERLAARKPASLGFAASAALPLTAITAWEMLFDRLKIEPTTRGSLLIVGGAGGVGSMAIQLARQLTGVTVLASASRPETRAWCERLGAHHVIDHRRPLAAQVAALVLGGVDYVFALTRTEDHFDEIVAAMAPQSALVLIENPARPLEITKLKPKSISLHWEFMFTRSLFQTADMPRQGELLGEVAALVDTGRVQTTMQTHLGPISAINLRRAHTLVESGTTIGKLVLGEQ